QELLEIAAAVGGDVGSDILAFAVHFVALGADLVEMEPARFGIARRLLEQVAHLGDELLALRIAAIADRAPDFGHLLDEFGVLAGEQLPNLVYVERARWNLLLRDFAQERFTPGCTLREQIDRLGLEFAFHENIAVQTYSRQPR